MNVAWGFDPPVDRTDAIRLIRAAYDQGITLFDTAEVYGPFVSEEFVGEALASVRDVTALQNEYSVWTRDPEVEVLKTCEELSIGLVAWGPLGKGYLTGTIASSATFARTDLRSTMPRFTAEAMAANRSVIELLERVGRREKAKPGQIALAWLLALKPWIVPIPGTTRASHLQENIGALDITLDAEDAQEIEAGFARLNIQGARSSEAVLALIDHGARLGTSSKGRHGISPPRSGGTPHKS